MRMICQLPDVCNVREDHAKSKKARVIRPYAQCSCRVKLSNFLLSYNFLVLNLTSLLLFIDGYHLGTSLTVSD